MRLRTPFVSLDMFTTGIVGLCFCIRQTGRESGWTERARGNSSREGRGIPRGLLASWPGLNTIFLN